MGENLVSESIKGERSMSQGFVAQYAAEAALRTEGVARLTTSVPVVLKESLGFAHEGKVCSSSFQRTRKASFP